RYTSAGARSGRSPPERSTAPTAAATTEGTPGDRRRSGADAIGGRALGSFRAAIRANPPSLNGNSD
ncbi:MAG: hypothetical protein WA688_07920, partial [Thermoplasmata archaeon]